MTDHTQRGSPRIAIFAMSDISHFNTPLALGVEAARANCVTAIWTDLRFKSAVENADCTFFDLFAHGTVNDADATSNPFSSRYVSFAARFYREIASDVAKFNPDIIIVEGFALIGQLVARYLKKPWIISNSGHCANGASHRHNLKKVYRNLVVDERCAKAVDVLKNEFGIHDASSFSFIPDESPYATLHHEPPEWLPVEEPYRTQKPLCFGNVDHIPLKHHPGIKRDSIQSIFISLGTIVWRQWRETAFDTIHKFVKVAKLNNVCKTTVALGGATLSQRESSLLAESGATIIPYANQIDELSNHDIFITHNGMGSTHEAIMVGTPMISVPFFNDQPELARLSQNFGIAVSPLDDASVLHKSLEIDAAHHALQSISMNYVDMKIAIEAARSWEIDTIMKRPDIIRSIIDII